MAKKKNGLQASYTLGLEELALGLGMINRPDLGRSLILDIYEGLSDEKIEERLTSASHSLLARGLVGLKESGAAVLDAGLEQAIFPLAKFDTLFQINITDQAAQVSARIHLIKGRVFTAHMVDMGLVHLLEHDQAGRLPAYVKDIFAEFSRITATRKQDHFQHSIQLGLVGEALELGDDQTRIKALLSGAGWPQAEAGYLAEDLARQEVRATLLRVEANSEMDPTQAASAPQQTLLLLQGLHRCWAFSFDGSGDQAAGTAEVLSRPLFERLLGGFVGKV